MIFLVSGVLSPGLQLQICFSQYSSSFTSLAWDYSQGAHVSTVSLLCKAELATSQNASQCACSWSSNL